MQHKQQSGFTIVELLIVVVVIAILAAITIVAFNGVINRAKTSAQASEISQWKRKSEVYKLQNNIECPANYVFVYGNTTLGTSDFCVMKYEAKDDGGGNAVSRADGTPWVSVTQAAAITAATATGGHLVTEAEWATIAADVLSVKYNWSGGEVGSGYIYQGHVNSNPASGVAASTDDGDGLFGMTLTGDAAGTNNRRTLYLSSGDVIWDLSGNVNEWTQQTIGTPTFVLNQIGVSGDSGFNWREWNLGSLSLGNLPVVSRVSTLASLPKLSGITGWNSSQGIGRLNANYADTTAHPVTRSGSYGSSLNGGVLSLALNSTGTGGVSVGFRVVR